MKDSKTLTVCIDLGVYRLGIFPNKLAERVTGGFSLISIFLG